MHFAQLARHAGRRDAITDAPAGGMQGLAEGENSETATPQFGVHEHRCVTPSVVQNVLVDFVGENANGSIAHQLGERIQIA